MELQQAERISREIKHLQCDDCGHHGKCLHESETRKLERQWNDVGGPACALFVDLWGKRLEER
jgi:hypothetical protein